MNVSKLKKTINFQLTDVDYVIKIMVTKYLLCMINNAKQK